MNDVVNANISAASISPGTTRIPYSETTYSIPAGGYVDVFTVFNYFRVLSLSGGALSIQFGQNGQQTPFIGAGVGLRFEYVYDRLRLVNTGGTTMTITVGVALGYINDDRLNVSGTVSVVGDVSVRPDASSFNYTQVSVNNAATLIDASNVNVVRRVISAGTTDLWLGPTNAVTATGEPTIYAGDSLEILHTGDVYGIRAASATGVNVGLYEELV